MTNLLELSPGVYYNLDAPIRESGAFFDALRRWPPGQEGKSVKTGQGTMKDSVGVSTRLVPAEASREKANWSKGKSQQEASTYQSPQQKAQAVTKGARDVNPQSFTAPSASDAQDR